MILDEKALTLLKGVNFAHLATLRKDGSPQVSPVWIDFDGTHIIVNSEEKRAKVRNLKRDPRVSLTITDSSNPYSYVQIAGRVVEITREGGPEGIDKLAQKYINQEKYPWSQPTDVRVVIKIEPLRVTGMG